MITRLYLGVHYPEDVIVGGILGILTALLGAKLYDKVKNESILFVALIAIGIPFAIIFYLQNDSTFLDFFKTYGLVVGGALGIVFEKRFVNFDNNVSVGKKILRLVLGAAICLGIKEGLKIVFLDTTFFTS